MSSKRERYERANIRGGMGVRHKLGEDSLKTTYRLNGVQTGSAVVRAHDKYKADFTKGFDVGVLVRKTASVAVIHWVGDDEPTPYAAGDARYEVDRGRWKFLGVVQGNPMDPQNPLAETLTRLLGEYKVEASAAADDPVPMTEEAGQTEETEEHPDMGSEQSKAAKEREAAQKQIKGGALQDRETYTAKQVATRCGTDSKTMRKFFRSTHSTVDPVGQGGRYEFDAKDFPKIKKEFDGWQKKAKTRAPSKPAEPQPEEHEGNAARRKREAVPITEVMDKAKQEYIKTKAPKGFGGIDRYGPDDPEVLTSFELLPDEDPSEDEIAKLEDEELDLDDLDED